MDERWLEVDMRDFLGSYYLFSVYLDSELYVIQDSANGSYRILNTDPDDCEELQDSNIVADNVSAAYVVEFFKKLANDSFQTFNPD